MITLMLVAAFVLACCLAAAGLIASTQDGEDTSGNGLRIDRDVEA